MGVEKDYKIPLYSYVRLGMRHKREKTEADETPFISTTWWMSSRNEC